MDVQRDAVDPSAATRSPLTAEEREDLGDKLRRGNRSMMCHFGYDHSVCGDPVRARVVFDNALDSGYAIQPHQARTLAISLLEAADHAEFFDAD